MQGELNRMKKVVDDSIKDKANLCAKLEVSNYYTLVICEIKKLWMILSKIRLISVLN